MENARKTVTILLQRVADGDAVAENELFSRLYNDLKSQAERYMRRQPRDHTLQSTALVHEAYARLFRGASTRWANRSHFLNVAAKAMRSVLVDHARSKHRQKRGGGHDRVSFDRIERAMKAQGIELLELDDALHAFAEKDPRAAKVVELRFFAGLSMGEVASVMDVPKRNVERDWTTAKIWLGQRLR
ncbi:MAG: ECF-type sigma factor [Planctomycetota bacterium]|nr:ECF-type sigma factor [Planctomycetota bacterium]